jgi:hypothetical protein
MYIPVLAWKMQNYKPEYHQLRTSPFAPKEKTMAKKEKVNPLYMDEEDLDIEGKAINIIKTTDIYCGKLNIGYQVVRAGLDVKFTPDLDKVHTLIDEYYNGGNPASKSERKG